MTSSGSGVDIQARVASVAERIAQAAQRVGRSPGEVTLVAATKGAGLDAIREAYRAGVRHFGENRVQEAEPKVRDLAPGPTWHMIGHLQTNKARTALALFDIIQSVDSLRLAQVLSHWSAREVPILLEVNLSGEATKSGFAEAEVAEAVAEISRLPGLAVKGLMTIAPQVPDPEQARPWFRKLRQMRDALGLEHLSMGMTEDFEVAVQEGATMVRLGRALFGERS